MTSWIKAAGVGLGLVLSVGMFGCTDAKDMQIQELQRQNGDLERERNSLQNELSRAQGDSENARRRALDLQQQLDALGKQPSGDLGGGWQGNEVFAWTDVADDILFDSGKNDVKPAGRAKLQQVMRDLQTRFAGREVWVVGHTDNQPIQRTKDKWQDNLDLSCNRAMAVVREFLRMGFDKNRVTAAGQGEYRPRASNENKQGQALNRRVQIIAVVVPAPSNNGGGVRKAAPTKAAEPAGGESERG